MPPVPPARTRVTGPSPDPATGRRRGVQRLATFCLLSLLFGHPPLGSQEPPPRKVIRKIKIEGLQREPEASITAGLKIHIGEVYDPARVSEETGNLFRTRKFRKVEPQVTEFEDGVAITFVVEERPVIETVTFQGRKALKEQFLKTSAPELKTKKDGLLNDAHVAEDTNTILEKYLDAGYIFAHVRSEVTETPLGVRVTFVIEEGTLVRIREVKFVGNKSVESSELLSIINTREKDFWFFGLVRPGFYNPAELERDLAVIETYYHRFGYFDAQAEVEDIGMDGRMERMTIVIRIWEGSQYNFRGYRFSNNVVFSDETLRDLTRAIPGQPFNADVLLADQKVIEDYYGDRAYIFARANPKLEPEITGNDVYVRFQVEEKNEIYIEEVKIEGNVRTQDRVVRRELEFYPGERVDLSKLTKSRSNLNRLQIFKPVDYSFENGASPSQKNVVVKIEEETPGRLSLGFGVTSGFGVIGNFRILKQNFDITDLPESLYDIPDAFTGAGQTLDLQAQPGTERSFYRLNFIEPYIFDTRNALSLAAQRLTIIREDWEELHLSFTPEIRHAFDFDRDLVFSLGYSIEQVDVFDLESDAPPDAVAAKGTTLMSSVNVGMRYNKLLHEYLEGPYDGSLNAISYEYGGGVLGGELDFQKIDIVNEFYYPLFTTGSGPNTFHHIISLANRFGLIDPRGDDDSIPIFERYFLGGANTVRGFEFRGLGPHQGNDPVGGTVQLWGNLEYSFPILFKLLRGVVFLDYGDLDTDYASFEISNMRLSTGVGVRINFPFLGQPLPIGLYFGYPIKKEPDDDTQFFLFTIGAPF